MKGTDLVGRMLLWSFSIFIPLLIKDDSFFIVFLITNSPTLKTNQNNTFLMPFRKLSWWLMPKLTSVLQLYI